MKKILAALVVLLLISGCSKKQENAPVKTKPNGEWVYDTSQIQTLPDGLKYVIIDKGNGPQPVSGQKVAVNYAGYLTNGKKFDSSFDRGEPITFELGVGQVIRGWDEGIKLLHKGDKAVLIIPPQLGYGARDMRVIPPNSTLIFDVQLVDIK